MTVDSLHGLLERSAARHPDRPAVIDGEDRLTYRTLDERSSRLARTLEELGVRRGDRVAILAPKSAASVVAIYGVLKAGAAYVPLDAASPAARIAHITRDCGVRALVVGPAGRLDAGTVAAAAAEAPVVVRATPEGWETSGADGVDPAAARVEPGGHTAPPADGDPAAARASTGPPGRDELAYLLYTSGSTGVPKGVALTHGNALAFVEWAVEHFGLSAEDRLSGHAPFHFDLSVFDLFGAAAAGAALVLVPPSSVPFPAEVAGLIRRERITVWYSVPSALVLLTLRGGLDGDNPLPSLRAVLFAGEVFPPARLAALMAAVPRARYYNLYGPTETNVCTCYEVPVGPAATGSLPIGTPVSGARLRLADENGNPVRGDSVRTGELLVSGPTVMRGYWGDPERTAAALVTGPGAADPAAGPAYRTGDLVRMLPDGAYQLIGRRDDQIKSRGHRIELGDVEAALHAHPQVTECAVVAVPDELVTHRLVAFVVAAEDLHRDELYSFCARRLPKYMIPETVTFLDALPRTSRGKVDRYSLTSGPDFKGSA
ncbi:amino acid adenylation domain-containing protein [Streptomyces sp. NPDC057638]|uniref:amino acid adenylation domain-containing protein n=1 Tax=Streptomyces sp. NPDC057638 TaxID=3346190 RepID=UPI00368BF907